MKKKKSLKDISKNQATAPFIFGEESFASSSSTRRNVAGSIERTDRFRNIEDGLVPFRSSSISSGPNTSSVDVRDAVVLCQKCYYNFSIFRNIIDLMTEFSVNNIYYKGGSQKSRDFFSAFYDKINLKDFQDKFFREYYRSGNVFIYRFDSTVSDADVTKITQVLAEDGADVQQMTLPFRYVILNPADVQATGTANFASTNYFKLLNPYEVARLKNPKNDEDKIIFESLPEDAQEQIKKGSTSVLLWLDPAKVTFIFYKIQDYEPFAVPMGFPVLEDINAKAEMKKIDMAIARTMQQIILLVTTGNEPDKGGINPKNIDALRNLFTNQSVGRVLVADYTTKAQFIVPDIGELLNPAKYEILERDINVGLNNVFAGGEKFANQAQKVELFVARLEQGRNAFLNNFLIPEIRRISKSLGFKNYPSPYFEDIELKDNTNLSKLYVRLMELGLLTPEQGLQAIETNTLPDKSLMIEQQQEYKSQRDKGLFEPLVGSSQQDAGRPDGTPSPRKVGPIGTRASEELYSAKKVKENLLLAQETEASVLEELKVRNNIKRVSRINRDAAEQIASQIFINEEPSNWKSSIKDYMNSPEDKNKDRINKVYDIAAKHSLDTYLASILLASQIHA